MTTTGDQAGSPASEAPAVKPVVVVHTNDAQMVAALVGAHSLKSASKSPDLFDVRILRLEETPYLNNRHGQEFVWWEGGSPSVWRRRDLQSFAPLRRMVPGWLGFTGRALVIDPDVFAVGDVFDLLARDMQGKAVLCRTRDEWRDGRRLYSSAVMLLDCARLRRWTWERDIDEIFSGRTKLGPWLGLLDMPPEEIGPLEEEWNHFDTLTEHTKLLHNTRTWTQPWKTGLVADFHEHAPLDRFSLGWMRQRARAVVTGVDRTAFYRPHPDPRQERLFFRLLGQCLDEGTVTGPFLRQAIKRHHLRPDTFELLEQARRPDPGA